MLHELHITDLGVIEEVDLELHPGLSVLTGETGAGKTMVTVALALALGERGAAHLVREGASRARVEARFDAPDGPAGVEWAEDGELVLARTVSVEGKSTGRIGGQIVPVSALAGVGGDLVEVHGQNQAERLRSPGAQTAFLDRFAGPEHLERVAAYALVWDRFVRARTRLEELTREARDREREKDLLAYQVREIESAGVEPGELEALRAEEARLAHAERLLERAAAAESSLAAEGGGLDSLREAATVLADAASLDPGAAALSARMAALAEEATDAAHEVRAYRETVALDPARLEEVRERVQAIRGLERKYGEGEEGILAFLAEARERLGSLSGADEELASLREEAESLEGEAAALAAEVSRGRAAAAPGLAAALTAELLELGMAGASVEVPLHPASGLDRQGAERAEVLFSGGSGQASRPLGKVASGGELSRAMLACRSVLADLDDVPTLVFDEVDAGIGGRAGLAVGRRLARLARTRQVLVVTHLPQIACFADRHFRVEKRAGKATVVQLADEERVAELSRMLSGLPGSEAAATHAEELLAAARATRDEAGGQPAGASPRGAGRRRTG
ncbi:MAG: DNA repair protein RecN [Actinobacteria bacterium]|nr:DNA repair protein RecN [Actinomycetota bacterium]